MYVMGFVSILLLTVAWRWWLEWEVEDDHVVGQGVLLAVLTVGWFLRIVFGPLT